ncbi:hypothetical protein MKX03_004432 [Papaver bracteatum]|nr:hypothetical protein MKX03_004432 [Papaver bracteatum]
MVVDSAALVNKMKNSREELLDLRIIMDYVRFLRNVNPRERYINKSEERVDLDILKELQAKLDHEYAKSKDKYFSLRFSYVYAHRKRAMMLQEISSVLHNENKFTISVDFRKWIERKLLDEDWVDTLKYTNLKQGQLKKEAEEDCKDVQLLIQTINSEQIEVNNPEIVKQRFMAYQKELADATRKYEENLYAYVHIPERCQSVERLASILEASCLCKPDGNSMVNTLLSIVIYDNSSR